MALDDPLATRVAAEIYARFMADQRGQLADADMLGKAEFAKRAGMIFSSVMAPSSHVGRMSPPAAGGYPGAGAGASPLGGQQTGGGAGASPLGGQATGGGSANASVGCTVKPSSRGASPVDPSACCGATSTDGHLCTLVVGHNGDHAAIAPDGASYLGRWS